MLKVLTVISMDEAASPTDVSSSLSEFVRKEKLLKELYQENRKTVKTFESERLKHNDEEIDCILQQMGKLLSPAGEETDNSVYRHVIEETENKSIEEILKEAKELVRECTPLHENSSSYLSTDDLSSECTENSINFTNVKSSIYNRADINGNKDIDGSDNGNLIEARFNDVKRMNNSKNFFKGNVTSKKKIADKKIKSLNILQNVIIPKKVTKVDERSADETQFLKREVDRFSELYETAKKKSDDLTKQICDLQVRSPYLSKIFKVIPDLLAESAYVAKFCIFICLLCNV